MNIEFQKFLNEKIHELKIPKFEYHTNIKLVLEADNDESDLDKDTNDMDPPDESELTDMSSSNDNSMDNSR